MFPIRHLMCSVKHLQGGRLPREDASPKGAGGISRRGKRGEVAPQNEVSHAQPDGGFTGQAREL